MLALQFRWKIREFCGSDNYLDSVTIRMVITIIPFKSDGFIKELLRSQMEN